MGVLRPPEISSGAFSYHLPERVFAADASDLGRDFRLGCVYDDAADVGLTLVSERTGSHVVCAVTHRETDREGDLLYLELSIVRPEHRRGHFRVRIYND